MTPSNAQPTGAQPTDPQLTKAPGQLAHTGAAEGAPEHADDAEVVLEDLPENVPTNAWITMGLFAVFVIAFGTCASTFMFN